MTFMNSKHKKLHAEVQELTDRVEELKASIAPNRTVAQPRTGQSSEPNQLSDDDMAELRGLRAAVSMMGLEPKKVAEFATGENNPGEQMMDLVKARMLFSSVEPSAASLTKIAGERTNLESWMRNWKMLARS